MDNNEERVARVLVVDDEDGIRQLLSEYLSRQGYEVEFATDGVDCLAKVDSFAPDIILLDLKMPKMDGVQVIRRLRELGIEVPVLVLSALADIGPYVETNELSLGEFVAKPFKLKEVAGLVETALLEAADAGGQSVRIPGR